MQGYRICLLCFQDHPKLRVGTLAAKLEQLNPLYRQDCNSQFKLCGRFASKTSSLHIHCQMPDSYIISQLPKAKANSH
ncbi:unnamed protein product [Periconia digitata]|uniref:Uncharacterized protein n=1 Tax=Periconia digitata TaxID=1303443 RepID=A0A9W4XVM3_9PLEO|nr:unnamed protein product [Periconia digitata]